LAPRDPGFEADIKTDILEALEGIDNDMQETEFGNVYWVSVSIQDGKLVGGIERENGDTATFELSFTEFAGFPAAEDEVDE